MANNPTIEELSYEARTFEPPKEFAAQANVKADEYEKAAADRIGYWGKKPNGLPGIHLSTKSSTGLMPHLPNGI